MAINQMLELWGELLSSGFVLTGWRKPPRKRIPIGINRLHVLDMTKILHPNGEITAYGLPSLSDLMWARDSKTHEVVFVNGNPVIVKRKVKKTRKRK